MRFAIITRWEFINTLKSRKFLLIFFMQLSILALMILVFNSFAANIETEKGLSLTPSLTDFATVDVQDPGGLFQKRINPEIIKIYPSNYNNSIIRVKQGETTGFYIVSKDSIERIRRGERVDTMLYLDYNDPKRSVVRDEINSTTNALASALTNSYLQTLDPKNTTQTGFKEEKSGEPLPMQIIKKIMLAVLLFLPLFLFGNMIIDSVVGEKERKTGEILIAMPITSFEILLGKALAVVFIIAIQVAMWMLILLVAGFAMKNPIQVYLIVLLTSLPVVGLTTIIAAYAKNYKEAGIGISLAYILMVGFLIVPALAYISTQSSAANISSMTTVMRLFSGETIPLKDIFWPIIIILLGAAVTLWIAVRIFERDDILFGPRPGVINLSLQLLGIKKR
jgi:ABC-2 type transport system permease protein